MPLVCGIPFRLKTACNAYIVFLRFASLDLPIVVKTGSLHESFGTVLLTEATWDEKIM